MGKRRLSHILYLIFIPSFFVILVYILMVLLFK